MRTHLRRSLEGKKAFLITNAAVFVKLDDVCDFVIIIVFIA